MWKIFIVLLVVSSFYAYNEPLDNKDIDLNIIKIKTEKPSTIERAIEFAPTFKEKTNLARAFVERRTVGGTSK